MKLQRERERERENGLLLAYRKGGQAVVGLFSYSTESQRGGQRYSLIGGDSYGC